MALLNYLKSDGIEAGCDEAGRGCLAGPVFAAAVILPKDFYNETLNDSKQLTEDERYRLRDVIQKEAIAYAVQSLDNVYIDRHNILRASINCMHKALRKLKIVPDRILVDGNRFYNFNNIEHHCIIKGDGIYASIAAASILAKTHRDDYMRKMHKKFPEYNWQNNKGYPTKEHRDAIEKIGCCDLHRMSFKLLPDEPLPTLFD
jgi:ribonuclease HII